MNEVNPRVTMIMGADVVLDIDFPTGVLRPSTWNITHELIKPYDDLINKGNRIKY